MPDVTFTIVGRNYTVSCPNGQENEVRALAQMVDDLVREIVAAGAAVGEAQPFVLACLQLAGEAKSARQETEEAYLRAAEMAAQHMSLAPVPPSAPSVSHIAVAKALADIAGQIHAISGRLHTT